MRGLLYILSTLAVIGLAHWAYLENYRTKAAMDELRSFQTQIGETRESLTMLRAEWAYLNRPERLRELTEMNFERLGLLPMEGRQFGEVVQIAYPEDAPPPLPTRIVDVSTAAAEGE